MNIDRGNTQEINKKKNHPEACKTGSYLSIEPSQTAPKKLNHVNACYWTSLLAEPP